MLGVLSFVSAPLRLGPRDAHLGWDDRTRGLHIGQVVSNDRFLLLPSVRVPHLASHVLGRAVGRLASDWSSRHGVRPVLVETCVEASRPATSYRAAGWECVGRTAGRPPGSAAPVAPKGVWLRGLESGWAETLRRPAVRAPGSYPALGAEDASCWARREFGRSDLADGRLRSRLERLGGAWERHPGAPLPAVFPGSAEQQAAYRFLHNKKVHGDDILQPHREALVERCRQESAVLLVQYGRWDFGHRHRGPRGDPAGRPWPRQSDARCTVCRRQGVLHHRGLQVHRPLLCRLSSSMQNSSPFRPAKTRFIRARCVDPIVLRVSGTAHYDPSTNQIDWTLGIGQDGTHMLVVDQGRDTMFMPNTGSNSVTMVEGIMAGPARATLTDIPVPGDRPEGIDLSPDGREIWTATRGDGGVSIIDVASRRVVETLDLGLQDANRLKFTPDGRVLIIDGEAASLVVMDAASRAVIKRVTLGSTDTGDGAVLVAPDGSRAYLGLRAADRVAVVDLNTLEVTFEMAMGDGAGPGCMYWIAQGS